LKVGGVGELSTKKYEGNRINAVKDHPATAIHEVIHLLSPPFE
jgi:hypothetical protein